MKWIHASDIRLGAVPIAAGELMIDRKTEYHDNFLALLQNVRQSGAELLVITGHLFDRPPGVRDMIEAEGLFASLGRVPVILFPYSEEEYGALNVYPWPAGIYLRSPRENAPVILKDRKCRIDFSEEGNHDLPEMKVKKGTARLLFLAPPKDPPAKKEEPGAAFDTFPQEVFGKFTYIGTAGTACLRRGERIFSPGPFSETDYQAENRGGYLEAESETNGHLKVSFTPHEPLRELRFSVGIRGSLADERLVDTLRRSGEAGTLFGRFTGEVVKADEAAVRRMAIGYGLRALTEEEESLKEQL